MNSVEALGRLREHGHAFVTTRDAAAIFGEPSSTVSRTLMRLAGAGLIKHLRRGHWSLDPKPSALIYAAWVTAPLPAYVSLYTALYHRGLISQLPRVIYVASLARTQEIDTTIGVYSVHQLQPALFGGYAEESGVRMATAEKALFDAVYLARARSGRFAGLTEIELPAGFEFGKVREYAERIVDPSARRRVTKALHELRRDLRR